MSKPFIVIGDRTDHGGMVVKTKSCLLSLLLAHGAATAQADFGMVKLDGLGHGTLITAKALDPHGAVLFQFPLPRGGTACCKKLDPSEFQRVDADTVVATNELTGEAPHVHRFRLPRLWAERPFVGIAVSGRRLEVKGRVQRLTVFDGQGRPSSAVTCTSQEGVHLIERRQQMERTHLYLSLGYDVEVPTCP